MTKHKTPESLASDNVLLAANANGCRLYRNNSGVAYDEKSNRPIFFGLGNDGVKNDESIRTHDWIGWHQVTITPDMVGKKLAVFTAIDAKKLRSMCSQHYSGRLFWMIVVHMFCISFRLK